MHLPCRCAAVCGAGGAPSAPCGNGCSELHQAQEASRVAVADAERRVADKQRAFNLLHADCAKHKADAQDAEERAAEQERR